MPLIKGKSKKAFGENVSTEMSTGKSQPQSLAIAYSVKHKAKKAAGGSVKSGSEDMNMARGGKMMADGGSISASSEKRPMPDNTYDDEVETAHNKAKKELMDSDWTGQPTVKQAQMNNGRKVTPIARPSMIPTNAFSTRLYNKEGKLQESASPGPYGAQPPKEDDEEGADRQGPQVPDMQPEHSTKRKPYADGGEVDKADYKAAPNKYEDDLTDLPPSEDEGMEMADSHDEMDQDGSGDDVPDMEDEHSTGRKPYADGGEISRSPDDSEMQPEDEESEEHHNSITAAIMAKRDRMHSLVDSGALDMDEAASSSGEPGIGKSDSMFDFASSRKPSKMADGGILSHDSIYSDDSDTADLSRNADEDANEEDQTSFNALRKENYSESAGLRKLDQPRDSNLSGDSEESDSENDHDMVASIRRKMAAKRQFNIR